MGWIPADDICHRPETSSRPAKGCRMKAQLLISVLAFAVAAGCSGSGSSSGGTQPAGGLNAKKPTPDSAGRFIVEKEDETADDNIYTCNWKNMQWDQRLKPGME